MTRSLYGATFGSRSPKVQVPEAPAVGDLLDLGKGTESYVEIVGLSGFVWPLGQPRPSFFYVVDDQRNEYKVFARVAGGERRTWSGERREK